MYSSNERFKVYLIECYPINMRDNSTRFIKIGISKNVERRLKSLQHSNPFYLDLLFKSPILDHNAKRLEKWLHNHLAEHRLKGEWFCLVDDDINRAQHFLEDEGLIERLEDFRFLVNHSQAVKDEWQNKILSSLLLETIWENCVSKDKPKRDYLFLT